MSFKSLETERIGKMVVAYDKKGKPVTTSDLEVAAAMTFHTTDSGDNYCRIWAMPGVTAF